MMGKEIPSEIAQVRQVLRTLLDLAPGYQTSKTQQKSILPISTDIQRYEKYLSHKKDEIKKYKQ